MRKALAVIVCVCFGFVVAACGPKAPETAETTPGPEASMTEVEDVEDEVEVEATTEETAEESDEEMAPPEG